MAERTPNLSTIRHAWAKAHPFPLTTDVEERYAEFDRAIAAHDAEKRAEWETEFLQNATVRVEYRDFETGPYSDPEPQSRRIIKTPWEPVNENGSER